MSDPLISYPHTTVRVTVRGGVGAPGKSAYQSYLDTTTDDPPMTETEWAIRIITPEADLIHTGDVTGGAILTISNVNSNVGSFGSSTSIPSLTVNAKGQVTAASSSAVVAPAGTLSGNTLASNVTSSSLTSFGAGIALGTPASGVATNLTGTASGLTAGNVVTIPNLTGVVTSVGTATSIADAALSITKTNGLQSALNLKAPLASPTFSGVPSGPTAINGTNTTQLATTQFVQNFTGSTNISTLGEITSGVWSTTGLYDGVSTSGAFASISTSGDFASISTSGANAFISTSGYDSVIYTTGGEACILTSGSLASIYTLGASATIYTALANIESGGAFIQNGSTANTFVGTIASSNTTASTSSTTGSIKTAGGMGVAKSLNVGEGISATGLVLAIVTKTTNYTATANDHTIRVNATSGNITITLPAAASHAGRIYNIKKIDATANTVTIDGNSSETIDGAATNVITGQYVNVCVQSNGSNWDII